MKLEWFDARPGESPPSARVLEDAGIFVAHHDVATPEAAQALGDLRTRHGYTTHDEVELSADTPNIEELRAKFAREHLHTEDEVRFVLAGEGIFDIRDTDDRFVRITVGPGDLLVLPAKRYHRFFLTSACHLRCARLFRDPAGWVPYFRPPSGLPGAAADASA